MFGLLLGKLRDLLAPVVYAEVLEIKSNYYDKNISDFNVTCSLG